MRTYLHILLLFLASFSQGALDFNRDVRPILSDKCFACHGPDEEGRKADLRLDIESEAKNDELMAIVAGSPEDSEMIYRVHSEDEDELMPPPEIGKPLTQEEKDILEQWIQEGAVWADHWAYAPPVDHPTPKVKNKGWSSHWIDQFALTNIEKTNLLPAKDADPVTLVRRLHFDLTGLPPSPQVVQSFESNPSEKAYSKIIEGLLNSPHFGERLATYWLDLVRYADTVGYHGDQPHNISPYRDWVIQAFNDNMTFDQFTLEQLAGDLLPGSTIQQKVASGYNRLLQTTHEGGLQIKEYDAIYAADRVRNVSEVWMGATVGCAQCHDHKYDPYTIKDHYALASFFSDLGDRGFNGNSLPTKRPPEIQIFTQEQQARIDSLSQEITKALPREIVLGINALDHNRTQFTSQLKKAKNNKKPPWKKKLAELETKYLELTDQASIDRYRQLVEQREKIKKEGRWTMVSRAVKPRTMRVLPRGNWMDDSGPVVLPSVPEFLGTIQSEKKRLNRLDLANWLTDPENGIGLLNARVLANRLWHLFFGKGLAPDLTDFGGQGTPPEHPELLDRLALSLVEKKWNIKVFIKDILFSRTYRQATLPPAGYQSYQIARRLPAEFVRDNTLAISGLLVPTIGGPSVKPMQPAGYYRHLNFPPRKYQTDKGKSLWRRGLYVHWQRQFLHPMLKAFDAPSREECSAERPQSNTPLAALVLLNDPTFLAAAKSFAKKIVSSGGSSIEERLTYAFRQALSRPPDAFEQKTLAALFDSQEPSTEDDWTPVARAVLNLAETNLRR
ncbi:MAG: PSD1 and planctomycete cytochrome C domain-containing protein [Opitutales bacterium]|nr:PSD1 and planctomycete cytochrome C domain-containing protein [Opitutales bacterium]